MEPEPPILPYARPANAEEGPPVLDVGGVRAWEAVGPDGQLISFKVRVPVPELRVGLGQIIVFGLLRWAFARRGKAVPQVLGSSYAVLEVDAREVRLTEHMSGTTGMRAWPRSEVTELRPNRFEPGFVIRIPGKVLVDVDALITAEGKQRLGEFLERALARTPVEGRRGATASTDAGQTSFR